MNIILMQLFNGLVYGSTYVLLALGLVIIYGALRVINFAQGSFYMLGAYGAYLLSSYSNLSFWWLLIIVPAIVCLIGMLLEILILRRIASSESVYTLLVTYGLMLFLQGLMQYLYGTGSQPIQQPVIGMVDLGLFSYPLYQTLVLAISVILSILTWGLLSYGRIGLTVRAATERKLLTEALGINVKIWVTPVFGFGIFLASAAGVLSAPMTAINPAMGESVIIAVFAIVVVGGLSSVLGAVVFGYSLGMIEAFFNLYIPALSNFTLFLVMAIILIIKPSGLFGPRSQV